MGNDFIDIVIFLNELFSAVAFVYSFKETHKRIRSVNWHLPLLPSDILQM